jgi:hypothetical protein
MYKIQNIHCITLSMYTERSSIFSIRTPHSAFRNHISLLSLSSGLGSTR